VKQYGIFTLHQKFASAHNGVFYISECIPYGALKDVGGVTSRRAPVDKCAKKFNKRTLVSDTPVGATKQIRCGTIALYK
jgi:hypothetical protein